MNQAPKAVVRPAEQTIQLPTHKAIVDASDSSDDATPMDALKFKWELTVNPVSDSDICRHGLKDGFPYVSSLNLWTSY